ncbi:hypothetical protein BX070DRAFT_97307 [Coemansia spiralis]|nr:hypothetical protein BX070DRAFT_97307 [Coemansia spiralis]
MSSNEDLKRQILELQTAINSYKSNGNRPSQPALRYSSSGSNRQSYRYSPIRPPGLFQPRPRPPPSRNMKLIVKNGEADSTAQYIRCGNKLTKVDAVNNKPQPTCLLKQRKVVIDGELFISKGYGKKLVRVSANKPQPEQQEQIQKQQRVVSIEGVNYVRTKKGSLVRVEALRSLGKPRIKRGPAKKRVCTKYLFGRCNKSKECRYSHKPTPETVPVCLHFQRGMCTNVDCPFIHIK